MLDQQEILGMVNMSLEDFNDDYADGGIKRIERLKYLLENQEYRPTAMLYYIMETQINREDEDPDRRYTEITSIKVFEDEKEAHQELGRIAFAKANNVGGMCSERYDYSWGSVAVTIKPKGGETNGQG